MSVEPTSTPHVAMPPPTPELVIIRTGAQAIVRALGRRKGEKFIREWATLLATEESVRQLFPHRALSDRAAVVRSRREAAAWLEAIMPTLVATLPDE